MHTNKIWSKINTKLKKKNNEKGKRYYWVHAKEKILTVPLTANTHYKVTDSQKKGMRWYHSNVKLYSEKCKLASNLEKVFV